MMARRLAPYRARRGDVATGPAVPVRRADPLVELPISWTLDAYPHFEFVRTEHAVLQGLMPAAARAPGLAAMTFAT